MGFDVGKTLNESLLVKQWLVDFLLQLSTSLTLFLKDNILNLLGQVFENLSILESTRKVLSEVTDFLG
jgi:hypothetical protein